MEPVMPRKLPTRRARLRAGGAFALALAWLASGQAAHAQAFQATHAVASGDVTVTTGANSTTINVFSTEAVINWTPTDTAGTGTINFLPLGATASFIAAGTSPLPPAYYTVLNRVLPVDGTGLAVSRAIQFNGTVTAQLADNSQGGNIWFYSPTGIIANKGASFSVGSLLLTTADIDTSGGLFGAGGQIRFTGPAASSSSIDLTGAVIDARNSVGRDSYVGIFAPRILQGGSITVDGNTALVAAEAGTITFSGGLFDFTVTQGTTDANGIVHTGSTGGPGSTGAVVVQQIKLVAMPKNTALTMLLSGTIGYAPAGVAVPDGSSVVLYAGYDPALPEGQQVAGLGNVSIGNATFSSITNGFATNTIDILPVADLTDPQNPITGAVNFEKYASLRAGIALNAVAEDAEEINASDNLDLSAGVDGVGGTVNVRAIGNNIGAAPSGLITSPFSISASSSANGAFFAGAIPDFTGGTTNVVADGGRITVNSLFVSSDGQGGTSTTAGGTGFGGTALVEVRNGGTITAQDLFESASGSGGSPQSGGNAGNGFGGNASLLVDETGGTMLVNSIGGDGQGGFATVAVNRGSLDVDGDVTIEADGIGGAGMNGPLIGAGGNGGTGRGGLARFLMDASGLGNFTAISLEIDALGLGGRAGVDGIGGTAAGGAAFGGTAAFDVADGAFSIGGVLINAEAIGGRDAAGGTAAVGGAVNFLLVDSGTTGGLTRSTGPIDLLASGRESAALNSVVINGAGTAGTIRFASQVGTASSALTVNGDVLGLATGATPNIAAFAASGNISVQAGNAALTSITGALTLRALRNVSFTISPGARLNADQIIVTALGTITGTGVLSATDTVDLIGDAGISMATLLSGDLTLLQALNGPVTVSTNLGSVGSVTVLGRSVDLVSTGALTFADADTTAGNLSIRTAGNLDLTTVDATGSVTLASTGASMHSTGAVNGVVIDLTAAGVILTDANVISAGALRVQAGGNYALGGLASGTSVTVTSGDIALGATARIGTRGTTQTVTLTNGNSARQTFIGGAAQAGGYSLTNAEAQRVFADQRITFGIPATAASPSDLVIGDLTLGYGATGTVGTGGTIKVNSPGRVVVSGAVRLTTSSAADIFSIDPTRIDVLTDTGSIAMLSGAGALQGRLDLIGGTVAVATSATLTALNAASGIAQINSLLDTPSTVPSAAGALQAGQINLQVTGGLYIQNSGSGALNADRRGFSANGFAITTAGPATQIVINGQTFGAAGIAVTGKDTPKTIIINGAAATAVGNFNPQSSTNGCVIGRVCWVTINFAPDKPGITEPLSPGPGNGPIFLPLIEVDDNDNFDSPPLIDEPITGMGNDDLWQSSCEGSDGCDKQGGNK